MRRVRQALKRSYTVKKATAQKDNEGNTYNSYGSPVTIEAVVRYASRMLDAAEYGQKVLSVLKMQYDGTADISEGDGVCVFVDASSDPDYSVKSVKGLTDDAFKVYTLEAIV